MLIRRCFRVVFRRQSVCRNRNARRAHSGARVPSRSAISPPAPREPPSGGRENISLALPRSPAVAIPPPAPPSRRYSGEQRRLRTASINNTVVGDADVESVALARNRRRDARRRVIREESRYAARSRRFGGHSSSDPVRARASRVRVRGDGHATRDLPRTRDAHPEAAEKRGVSSRTNRGPTHDMAKVSPRNETGDVVGEREAGREIKCVERSAINESIRER